MPFTLPLLVTDHDIDDLGHVSNLVYLRWVLQAAVAHSQSVGLPADAYRALGQAFVVRRHEVDYLRPAFAGDRLEIETRVTHLRPVRSQRETLIRRLDGALLCQARTDWAYIDLRSGRPARIPDGVRSRFTEEPPAITTVGPARRP